MGRRLRGMQHMINTKDTILTECHPEYITWEEFLEDCEEAVNNPELHSDEYSSDDETLAQDERDCNKRPERIRDTNSVIKVRNKQWRFTRVCISCGIIF